jgi:myo-inositol-1-phosphate synthase
LSKKVRVGIIGVGNCASSLVQGVHYYREAKDDEQVPGLMHVNLGGYHVSDIEFSTAIDIDAEKVGKDLSEAIWSGQNNTIKFADVPKLNVPVHRGMTHDGLGKYLQMKIKKAPGSTANIEQILRDTGTDVVINFLPVGSEQATKWYVEQVLNAGCAFVNCIPVFIAREEYWQNRFKERGLPVIGDDIKSQVGAIAACAWNAPASSTWAATWTSTTCWSASAWRARRSARPTRSPLRSITIWARGTSTLALATTWSG